MSEIKIKCPTCGKILRLNDTPNIDNASFTCPVCREKHIVGNCQRYVEPPKYVASVGEETQYGSLSSRQTSTEEAQMVSAPQGDIGYLEDRFGNTYKLHLGINTIGRKANTSTATLQIDTTDRTMSRSHAIIEVRDAGGQIIHILRNGANKNPSYHNGTLIGSADQLILNNGDAVKFGSTELTFKK